MTIENLRNDYQALATDPAFETFCKNLEYRHGYVLGALGRYADAKRILEPLWKGAYPIAGETLLYIGLGYFSERSFRSAQECFLECIGVPSEIETYARFYLGVSYFELGNVRQALQEFERCAGRIEDLGDKKNELATWLKATESRLSSGGPE